MLSNRICPQIIYNLTVEDMDAWMNGWIYGWMDECMDGWMGG